MQAIKVFFLTVHHNINIKLNEVNEDYSFMFASHPIICTVIHTLIMDRNNSFPLDSWIFCETQHGFF